MLRSQRRSQSTVLKRRLRGAGHSTPVEYGRYHLYQPISILGYQENLNLTIPNTEPIPSFLFFYAEEFDRIYDLDAALNFGLQVGVEIGMFFLFGGAGALRHLRHLRHISKLKHLRPATNSLGLPTLELVGISADDAVIVWRALDASTETIAVTAAIMTSLFEYQSQTENDPQKAALLKKTSDVFMYMALATGLTSMFARNKATKLADEIIENTTPSILNTLPQDVLGVLQSLRGQKVNAILNFGNTLQSLPLPNNVLYIFYNSLDNLPELKDLFWRDFNKLTKIEDWNFLNNTAILNRWKNMAELDIAERINFDILNSLSKTNAIVRYYSEPALKNILETISFEKRWAFLDSFNSVNQEWFDFLLTKPESINRWLNLTGNGKLIAKENPTRWLYVYDRLYENLAKSNRLPNSEILQRFGQKGLDLVNEVETFALQHISTATKNQLKLRDMLISGMKDKNANISSDLFVNFSNFKKGGDFDLFMNSNYIDENSIACFPNLKKKIDDIIKYKHPKNYNLSNSDFFQNTGKKPGSHAEIRALDSLAKKKFGSNIPSDEVFDLWLKNDVLGYNRNIQKGIGQQDVIMHTCADCFHILDLVTFIRP